MNSQLREHLTSAAVSWATSAGLSERREEEGDDEKGGGEVGDGQDPGDGRRQTEVEIGET